MKKTTYKVAQRTREDAVAIAVLRQHFTVEVIPDVQPLPNIGPRKWLAASERAARKPVRR